MVIVILHSWLSWPVLVAKDILSLALNWSRSGASEVPFSTGGVLASWQNFFLITYYCICVCQVSNSSAIYLFYFNMLKLSSVTYWVNSRIDTTITPLSPGSVDCGTVLSYTAHLTATAPTTAVAHVNRTTSTTVKRHLLALKHLHCLYCTQTAHFI